MNDVADLWEVEHMLLQIEYISVGIFTASHGYNNSDISFTLNFFYSTTLLLSIQKLKLFMAKKVSESWKIYNNK